MGKGKEIAKAGTNNFPVSRILDEGDLVRLIQDGIDNEERFCFILGSGASVKSGIDTGQTFEKKWMDPLMGKGGSRSTPEGTEKLSKKLQADGLLANSFDDIKKDWDAVEAGKKEKMDSRYYDDLFRLRYFYRKQDGYKFLEDSMKDAFPSLGYHPLALFLTQKNGNNLVITLNFDSLVEDALALYTTEKPQVINHEHLTKYLDFGNTKRPLVAKLHHGLFFAPINDSSKVSEEWTKNWTDKLSHAFHTFTPIVIGYNGGDVSFMNILKDKFPSDRQLYWCALHSPDEEYFNPEVRKFLLESDQRFFVKIRGFDEVMLNIGQEMFPERIGVDVVKKDNEQKNNAHLALYRKQFNTLTSTSKPTNATEHIERAKQLYWSENIQDAINTFTLAIEMEPNNVDAYIGRGLSWDKLQKHLEAVDDYTHAIKIAPTTIVPYIFRGSAYVSLKDYSKAIEDYNRIIELKPNLSFAYEFRGKIWAVSGDYSKAILDFNDALALDPTAGSIYFERAQAWADSGNYSMAIDDYNKAIEINPPDSIAYYNRGLARAISNDYNMAIEVFTKAIDLDPTTCSAYHNRGASWLNLDEFQTAIEDFNKAIEINSTDGDTFYLRGLAWFNLEQYATAIENFTMAINLNPNDIAAYCSRGEAYANLTNYQEAIDDFSQVISLNPSVVEAYNNRGYVWFKKDVYVNSIEDYNQAINLAPSNPHIYLNRAIAYDALGQPDLAEADRKKAAELESKTT